MSPRERDNRRLLGRIREHHTASDGVMGTPRMHEVLTDEGETASRNRIARLMAKGGLQGIPHRRQWRRKRSGIRPAYVRKPPRAGLHRHQAEHQMGDGYHLHPHGRLR